MTPLDIATFAGNVITAALLGAAGIAALSIARSPTASAALPPRIAIVFGAGLISLALDELFDVHERAGKWLYDRGVEAPGPINHVDDVILLTYAAAGAIALTFAMPALMRMPRLLFAILGAGVLFVAAAALDALATPGSWVDAIEEALEAAGAVVLAFAFARERMREPLLTRSAALGALASDTVSLPQSRR